MHSTSQNASRLFVKFIGSTNEKNIQQTTWVDSPHIVFIQISPKINMDKFGYEPICKSQIAPKQIPLISPPLVSRETNKIAHEPPSLLKCLILFNRCVALLQPSTIVEQFMISSKFSNKILFIIEVQRIFCPTPCATLCPTFYYIAISPT